MVGLDDTDSSLGGCTTYLGFRLVSALAAGGSASFRRYPRLVRLNPNVPFKTRGNAAVCLDFDSDDPRDSFRVAEVMLRRYSEVGHGANSGAVFFEYDQRQMDDLFRPLYLQAIRGIVNPRRVERLLEANRIAHRKLGNGMGVVGAAASLGFREEEDDHTYELIAYRRPEMCGSRRLLSEGSVIDAERALFPHVLNNYDHGAGRVLVAPHGPDPVFLGVRADSPGAALDAFRMIRYPERLEGLMLYLTNQCTDAHVRSPLDVPLRAYSSGWVRGTVRSVAEGAGRHLYLELETEGDGRQSVRCAVYRPASDLLRMMRKLAPGDRVVVYGGVRRSSSLHPPILNVEKVEVLETSATFQTRNPSCPRCGGSTKSEGRSKGFQCRTCGERLSPGSRAGRARKVRIERGIYPGVYLPPPGAQRHLTMPLARYLQAGRGAPKVHPLVGGWLEPDPMVEGQGLVLARPLRAPVKSPR